MDPQKIDVVKVQQTFHRLSLDNSDKFETYQKYVLSFCLVSLKNSNFNNITLDHLKHLLKEEPERIRFPNAIVFDDGHVERAFISNYFKKVYILQQLGCPPSKHLCVNAVVSCENHVNFLPWDSQQQHFWHCGKLKTAVAYQWLESRRNANQANVFNVDSKFERLCVGCSKQ